MLTSEAVAVLSSAATVWLRTSRHPTVDGLPEGPEYRAFDELYDASASFDDVYAQIVVRVRELAREPEGCVYAVPGHPLFGEATVRGLLDADEHRAIDVRIVPGLSYVDVVAPALGLDLLGGGCLLLDALALAVHGRGLAPQRPTIVAQVYDRRAASAAKLALLEAYPPDHKVSIVRSAGTPALSVETCELSDLDHADTFDHLTTLYVPPLAITQDVRTFEGLRAVVAQLRNPDGGCPWDLEQTHESLKRYVLEEAYETLDALDSADPGRLSEELGDLMMQVVLHAQVAEDHGEFVIEDVIDSIATKLIRRHPHVFGETQVEDARDVLKNWEVLKQEERGDAPLLDAVPRSMPALMQAQSVQSRAERNGVASDITTPDPGVLRALSGEGSDVDGATLGELLFAIVARARAQGLDAEDALRGAITRYREEIGAREAAARG